MSAQVNHVILAIPRIVHKLGIAHDMCHHLMARFVGESAGGLGKSWRHEVPDSTANASLVGIDGTPHLVEHTTAVASHRYVFIHKRGAHVTVAVTTHPEIESQRRWVARTNDVLGRMAVGITAVHPPAGVVVFAAFVNHLADVRTFTALVASTPEQYRRLVTVAQHHSAHTLPIHWYEAFVA